MPAKSLGDFQQKNSLKAGKFYTIIGRITKKGKDPQDLHKRAMECVSGKKDVKAKLRLRNGKWQKKVYRQI